MVDPEKSFESMPLLPDATATVSPQECQQHQRLLQCFFNLKQTISGAKGLFNAEYAHDIRFEQVTETQLSMLKQRRWSIYITRAVRRFTIWWDSIPGALSGQYLKRAESYGAETWTCDQLPPLDVLMVLHALILHGNAFREDCLRHGKIALWSKGFPLHLASQSIDPDTLTYTCSEAAKLNFERTGLAWDNFDDPDHTSIECFRCQKKILVPWTTRRNKGFAHKQFHKQCESCKYDMDKHTLMIQKLRRDVHFLLNDGIPMPGTCSSTADSDLTLASVTGVNRFIRQSLRALLLEEIRPSRLQPYLDETVKASAKAVGWKDKPMLHDIFKYYNYVENSSCDLQSAVMRISESISCMQGSDYWSRTDCSRIERRYARFLQQHSKKFNSMTDPIVLVWSTHQLNPPSYSLFSQSTCNGVLVDWEPAHNSATCDICYWLYPPSLFGLIRYLLCVDMWKEWLESLAVHWSTLNSST